MGERPGPGLTTARWCFGCGSDAEPDDEFCLACGMPVLPDLTAPDAGGPFTYDTADESFTEPEGFGSTTPPAPEPDPVPAAAPPTQLPTPTTPPQAEPPRAEPPTPEPTPHAPRPTPPTPEPTPPAPSRRPPSDRHRPLTAAVIVLTALLATAGVYLGYTRWTASPAETAIQDYFAALADGDAAKALSHVDLPAGFDISRYPLLTEPALADAGNRPKDLEIGSDGTQTFDVTFTAGGSPVRQRIAVVRNGDRYLLTNPFVVLAVSGDRNRQLIVNGVAVTPGDNTAFPSAYRVVAAGNRLFAESSITVTPGGNGRSAKAAFDTPALADGAQASIQDAVRVKLDQCAAAAADRTPHCPFWLRVPGYHPYVRWLIVDYPELTVGVASSVRFSSRSRGTVAWQLSFTSSYGQVVEKSGTLTFPVNGTATPATSGIDVVIDET